MTGVSHQYPAARACKQLIRLLWLLFVLNHCVSFPWLISYHKWSGLEQ
jgi:hypothetical protein